MADSDITIVGLTVNPGSNQNVLRWAVNDPHSQGQRYLQHKYTEIYGGVLADMSDMRKLGDAYGSSFTHTPIYPGQMWYYRALAINQSDQSGDFTTLMSTTSLSTGYGS